MQQEHTFVLFSIGINVLFFLMGYAWCKLHIEDRNFKDENDTSNQVRTRKKSKRNDMKLVAIDSTKVVVDLKTDHLEKKYENLGDVQKSEEKITNSVNKLKNMKR